MKFYYVYVLESLKVPNWKYVGYSEDLKKRFESHNKFENTATKHYAPLTLIHYEAYRNKKDAKRREMYLKTTKGNTTMKTMLQDYYKSK